MPCSDGELRSEVASTTDLVPSRLFVYPVDSLGGIEVRAAEVDARGLQHDHHRMSVAEDGVFLSQRELPRMGLTSVRI